MKKVLILILFLFNLDLVAQSGQSAEDKKWRVEMTQRNGFPASDPSTKNNSIFNQQAPNEPSSRTPIIRVPLPSLSKEEKEQLKKEEEAINAIRTPNTEDVNRYREFLSGKNTGLFRLFPEFNCESKYIVSITDKCSKYIFQSKSYSISRRTYGDDYFYDLRLKGEKLFGDGFLTQNIITAIGDTDLQNVTKQTVGMDFLIKFKPEKKSKKAKIQFAEIAKEINLDGLSYGKSVGIRENTTYLMRIISYQISNRNLPTDYQKISTKEEDLLTYLKYDKRKDKLIAFRIIRKEADGSISILWKELSNRKAPILVFEKGEKITDLR